MLKGMILRNFVNFKETQVLNFNRDKENCGVFLFVGANGTGKSSVFEAVRRCSDVHLNKSVSSRDPSEESIVICQFGRPNDQKENTDELMSYYMQWNENSSIIEVKIIVITSSNSDSERKIEIVCSEREEGQPANYGKCQALTEKVADKLLQKIPDTIADGDRALDGVVEVIKQEHKSHNCETLGSEKFDEMFAEFVRVEFLFTYRGLSLMQSSDQMHKEESQRRRRDQKEKEKKFKPNGKSFIITDFLQDNDGSKYDKDLEDMIFRTITSTSSNEHVFEEYGGIITLKTGSKKAKLIKAPEGIVEAKFLSVLLAKRDVSTLLIEEAGRGMHKNFTDILIHRVLSDQRFISRKTIIITTHNRDFLNPSTLQNTIFFFKDDKGFCETNSIGFEAEMSEKVKQYVTSSGISTIFFSKHSLLVEGKTDAIFVETIKDSLLGDDNKLETLCQKVEDRDQTGAIESLKNFLATLQVIPLYGKENKRHVGEICDNLDFLKKKCLYLMDEDAKETASSDIDKDHFFYWNCKLTRLDSRQTDSTSEQAPSEPGENVLKHGALEDVMLQTVRHHIRSVKNAGGYSEVVGTPDDQKDIEETLMKGKRLIKTSNKDFTKYVKTVLDIALADDPFKEVSRFLSFLKRWSDPAA